MESSSEVTDRSEGVSRWFAPVWPLLVGGLVLGGCGAITSFLPMVAAGAFFCAVALFLLPVKSLPSIALWLLVLLPIGFMDVPGLIGDLFTPSVLVIAVWMLRLAFDRRLSIVKEKSIRGWLILAPFIGLLFASTLATERIDVTLVWTAVFAMCVLAPAILGQLCMDDVWPTVRWTFAGIGLFLGVLAAADYFLHFNPWASLYRYELVGSSVFRTRTSLGHPLTTAMVASIALVVCVFPSGTVRQWRYWACALGALVALVFSVSRTSLFAVGAAVLVGIFASIPRTRRALGQGHGGLFSVLVAIALFVLLAASPLLSQRNSNAEGISSAAYRSQVFDVARDLISERPLLGFGPGMSSRIFGSYSRDPLENSALQLMVSLGLPTFALLAVGIIGVVLVAMRRARAGVAAGIVAFCVSTTGFNIIDASPAFLVLFSPLIVCAVMPSASEEVGRPREPVRRRAVVP